MIYNERYSVSLASHLDEAVDAALTEERIVGTVVVVAKDGEVAYRRAAGWADREADRPMREDALFRLASMTKPLTSAAAMALAGQGRLDLDAPIEAWLPEFRPLGPDGRPAAVTARQLLSHTAGLSYRFLEPEDGDYVRAGVSDGVDRAGLTLEENLRRIASVPLRFAPGTAWGYSLAVDVLGALVERVAGTSLPEALRTLVTEPLGLRDTGFAVADPDRLAAVYVDGSPRPRRLDTLGELMVGEGLAPFRMDPSRAFDPDAFPSGGASAVGSADDYLRFLEALRTGGAPILPAGLADEMARDQTGGAPVSNWPGWGFGLGFAVLNDPAATGTPQSAGTWQWGGAYGHSWFVDRAQGLSVVALTNTAFEGMVGGGRFPGEVVRAVYGA